MKALVYRGPREFGVEDTPAPRPTDGQVVLAVEIAGVCGTDLHIHNGGFQSRYPLIPGHEIVGRVVDAAAGVTEPQLGQRVVADEIHPCGRCNYCKRGQASFCSHFYSLGVNGPGAFAQYVAVRAANCFPADDLDLETAVMAEPTACAVHGVEVLDLRPGSDVLLFGAGPSGQILAQLLSHGGAARLTIAAPTEEKLAMARRNGADRTVRINRSPDHGALRSLKSETPEGYDAVVDATGSTAILQLSTHLVRDGGTILMYGITAEDARLTVHPYEIFRRELTLKGSFAQTNCFDRALTALRTGRVNVSGIVTHRFPLSEYACALGALAGGTGCFKAAVVPG